MFDSKGKPKIFYGWWIVIVATVAHALSGGFYLYGFSTFFIPLVTEFGWSRAAVSGAFALSRMEGGLLGPIGGYLVDRFGPRKMMIIGVLIMGAGFMLFSRINSLISFYLVFILTIALGVTLGIHQTALVAIANWFKKKRGIAFGIGISGIGFGGILVPVLAWLIVQHGWRSTAVIAGFILWCVGIPLALIMRHRPEQYGYLPDGETKEMNTTSGDYQADKISQPLHTSSFKTSMAQEMDYTPRQALRTAAFWLLALIFGLRQFVVSAMAIHQIPFLIGIGIQPELAAAMLGSIAVLSIVGRLGFGRLADIFEKRYVMIVCLALMSLSCIILAMANTWWHIIPFLIIYSPAYGGGAALMFSIRADYFGRQYFGTVTGFMDLAQMFGLVLGPVFAGWVFDVTESYRLAFIVFAISAALAMSLLLVARRPKLTQ